MYVAEKDLYSFFLIGDGKVTYTKLRAIIKYLSEHKYKKDVRSAFYNLINTGVVIQTGENQYELAHSQLLKGNKFCVGINIGENGKLNFDKFPGIKIYKSSELPVELECKVYDVNVMKGLRAVPNLKELMRSLCFECMDGQRDFKKLSVFEAISGNWEEVNSSIVSLTELGLFKVYPFANHFFEYVLKYKGKQYRFKMSEIDRIEFIKIYILMKSTKADKVWEYDSNNGKLIVRNFFPSLIERQLRIHHVITTGTLPYKREYNVDRNIVKQIERIFSL